MTHTSVASPRFHYRVRREPRSRRFGHGVLRLVITMHVVLATASGYRAIVQVYRVHVAPPLGPLRPGVRVEAAVVTSGRTYVTVHLELRQGERARILGVMEVPGNREGVYDPRPRHATAAVALTPAMLRSFAAGPAVLRAIATGRAQWLRVPPPTAAERRVVVEPE